MSSFSKDNAAKGCLDHGKCLQSLQLILDGEASRELEDNFVKHLNECMHCYNLYHLDKAVKELVQTKIRKIPVPSSLHNKIRNQLFVINQTA
jgi:anti-sigma factor (TIGR02949 family)